MKWTKVGHDGEIRTLDDNKDGLWDMFIYFLLGFLENKTSKNAINAKKRKKNGKKYSRKTI